MLWLLAGGALWTLQEYLVHRFLLHRSPFKTEHWRHHERPRKSVFIPAAISGALAVTNFAVGFALYGLSTALQHLSMNVLYYTLFEIVHFTSHSSFSGWLAGPRLYHLRHHSSSGTVNFGITSATWDIVFGTCDPDWTKTRWKTAMLLVPLPMVPLLILPFF